MRVFQCAHLELELERQGESDMADAADDEAPTETEAEAVLTDEAPPAALSTLRAQAEELRHFLHQIEGKEPLRSHGVECAVGHRVRMVARRVLRQGRRQCFWLERRIPAD